MGIYTSNQHTILFYEPETCDGSDLQSNDRKNLKHSPGVVFRVPAMTPLYPYPLARSWILFDLSHPRVNPDPQLADSGRDLALCRDAATPGEHVESNSLSKQKMPGFPPYGRNVLNGLERLSFLYMPFHPAPHREHSRLGYARVA